MHVRLIKSFGFEAAHHLPAFPDGHKCRRMHGHSFKVEVVVAGEIPEGQHHLIDYGELTAAIEPIRKRLDHYCLNDIEGLEHPTSERLAEWIWQRLAPASDARGDPRGRDVHEPVRVPRAGGGREAVTLLVERPLEGSNGGLRTVGPVDGDAPPMAVRDVIGNPLAGGWTLPDPAHASDVIAWSGSLADALDASHPHNWMGPGRAALDERCAALAPELAARGGRLLMRPHRRHVLSDAPSCARFLDDHADAPLGIALDPVDLFEPSMLEAAEDHLIRILERLGGRCAMLFVEALLADDPNRPVPAERMRELITEFVDPATPLVLGGDPSVAQSLVRSLASRDL